LQTELQHVRELLERSDDSNLSASSPSNRWTRRQCNQAAAQPRSRDVANYRCDWRTPGRLDDEMTACAPRASRRVSARPELLARYEAAFARVGTLARPNRLGSLDGCRIALSPLDLDRWKVQRKVRSWRSECGVCCYRDHPHSSRTDTSNAARLLWPERPGADRTRRAPGARAAPFLLNVRECGHRTPARSRDRDLACGIAANVKESFIEVDYGSLDGQPLNSSARSSGAPSNTTHTASRR